MWREQSENFKRHISKKLESERERDRERKRSPNIIPKTIIKSHLGGFGGRSVGGLV